MMFPTGHVNIPKRLTSFHGKKSRFAFPNVKSIPHSRGGYDRTMSRKHSQNQLDLQRFRFTLTLVIGLYLSNGKE